MATTKITILTEKKDNAIEIIEKINRKAVKLGVEKIAYQFNNERIENVIYQYTEYTISYIDLILTNNLIKLNETWKLGGTIEAYKDGNLINAVPSLSDRLPTNLRTSKLTCEHCKTKRFRKKHIIVVDKKGTTKIVGTSCVKDFLGHDALARVKFFQNFKAITDELCGLGNIDNLGGNFSGLEETTLRNVISTAIAIIRIKGWQNSKAYEQKDRIPTYCEVVEQVFESHTLKREQIIEFEDEDWDKTDLVLERWQNIAKKANGNSSEWDWKKKLIVSKEYVNRKKISLVTGMVYGEISSIERERIAKDKVATDVFFGTEKVRAKFEIKIQQVKTVEAYYGRSNLVIGIDTETGGKFKWFDSTQKDWYSENNTYKVKATIKAHESSSYGNQTVLSRVTPIK